MCRGRSDVSRPISREALMMHIIPAPCTHAQRHISAQLSLYCSTLQDIMLATLQGLLRPGFTGLVKKSERTRKPKGSLSRCPGDEDAVNLPWPDQRLSEQLALCVLAAVEEIVALTLSVRYSW